MSSVPNHTIWKGTPQQWTQKKRTSDKYNLLLQKTLAMRLRQKLFFFFFYVQRSVHHKYIPFDIFPTRCNITHFIYFWKTALRVSGGISAHHQEHTQLYLQYPVLVKPLLLPAAIVEELEPFWVWCGNCIDLFWCGCILSEIYRKG